MAEVVNGLHKHNLRLAKGRSKALDNKQYWEGYLAAVLANPQRPLFLYRRMVWRKIRWPYNARMYQGRVGQSNPRHQLGKLMTYLAPLRQPPVGTTINCLCGRRIMALP